MNEPDWSVEKATPAQIDEMLALNYAIYPEEWHVGRPFVEAVMAKNPQVYNILRTPAGVKGIFSIFPLPAGPYEQVLCGDLEEGELASHLLDYDRPRRVRLYLISIIVDIHDPLRKAYARAIVQAIPGELQRLAELGIEVEEIGAIAITEDGNRILRRIGFTAKGEQESFGECYPIYRASPEDVVQAISLT